jgi:Ca-activated chloride channel family protein
MLATVVLAATAFAQDAQPSTAAPQQQQLPSAPSATQQTFPGATKTPEQQQPTTKPSAPAPSTQNAPSTPSQKAPVDSSSDEVPIPAQNSQTQSSQPATAPSSSSGQQGSAPTESPNGSAIGQNEEGQYSYSKTVNEVNTVFTVTDKHGHFIKDLKLPDIKIIDDGKAPADIRYFTSETGLPLRVGLLIDASNSIRDRFRFEQESAIEFLNQIVRRNSDQAFVIGFDSTPEVKADFTDDTNKLGAGVRDLRPGGGTALYDAIYYACRDKLAGANSKKGPVRKAIILLSDGEDNQSRVLREEAVEMAERAEVIIYAISTNISGVKTRGDKVLERFADMTGGRVFFPYKLQDVADAFTGIQEELRSQYAVAYKPQDFIADGKFRVVSIEPAKNKNLKIRSRRGYYAPKK